MLVAAAQDCVCPYAVRGTECVPSDGCVVRERGGDRDGQPIEWIGTFSRHAAPTNASFLFIMWCLCCASAAVAVLPCVRAFLFSARDRVHHFWVSSLHLECEKPRPTTSHGAAIALTHTQRCTATSSGTPSPVRIPPAETFGCGARVRGRRVLSAIVNGLIRFRRH